MMLTRTHNESEFDDDLPIWQLNTHEDLLDSSSDSSDAITAIQADVAPLGGRDDQPRRATGRVESRGEKHFFWIRWICGWPKLTFTLTLSIQIAFVAITAGLYATGYPIFPTAFSDMPMENLQSLEYRRFLALKNIHGSDEPTYTFIPSRRKRDTQASVSKYRMDEEFFIFYKLPKGQNVLQKKYLERIKSFESILQTALSHPFGDSEVHLSDFHRSVIKAFYPNLTSVHSYTYLEDYVGKTAVYNRTARTVVSNLARSTFYATYYGNEEWDAVMDYLLNTLSPKVADVVDAVFEDIEAYVWNFPAYGEAIKLQVFKDLYLFIGSVIFIFTFILIQTASFWITFWGTTSIVVSFLGANLVYDCIIGYKYFGLFNVLALFIVLGLGADDIFIFLDTWKSLDRRGLSMEERMSQTYKKAVLAMLNTSLTTMVAFMVNAFAPILPIRTFGLFAGLTVIVNFMSVVVFFPTVVAVHHYHFEKACCARSASYDGKCIRIHQRVARFFGISYFRFVTHKYIRWVIVVLFALLLAGMSVSLSHLKVDEKPDVQLFISSNKFEEARHLKEQGFKQNVNDIPVKVLMIWGLKPRDMSSCDPRYYKPFHPCPGLGVFDDKFDIEKAENQLAMQKFCRSLNSAEEERPELMIHSSNCMIDKFEETIKSFANISLPITSSKVEELKPLLAAALGIKITGTLETPFSTLLYLWSQRAQTTGDMFGFVRLNTNEASIGKMRGVPFYNMRLQYMLGAEVTTNLTVLDFGVNRGMKLMKQFESFMNEESEKMPVGLKRGFQASYFWYRLMDRLQIVDQGTIGVGVSLSLSFVLILLATQNIILSILACLSLCSAVICVLGIMPMAGWSLGILEGLNMAFVAGLSVDYILHIVHAYRISKHQNRLDRTQDSLHAVGVSVVSGAITTLGSSAFIMFSQIEFFLEFGVFIFCTVGFSVLHAMLLFPALLSICGPSRNQGYLLFFCKESKRSDNETGEDIDYIQADDF